ncbi:zinc finger protein 654 [Pelodytes ibericus]
MAEDESDQESERLVEELEAINEEELQGMACCKLRSREYCRRFCEVVEEYTARWQVPLPQLQVLQTALCCFTSASVSFPAQCEHVQYVLSRLALSLFELLLFFGKDEFYEVPLKDLLGSVQECHDLLVRYASTDLLLVTGVIKDGGPWEDPVLQAVLKGKSEPQDIVDRYLRSENPLFFELRVRYLIACERIPEAMALITTCLSHHEVGKNLYYHQAYFTCLHMARLTDELLYEHVRRIDCTDGVQIICDTEKEGKTALALQLSESFLITQLQTGAMYCIWDLIFLWSKLQLKTNPSKQVFVEQCYHMLRIATNVKVIFPFMKTIIEEIGETGVQLSVELCGCALQLHFHNDPETKSLIYKTIAHLLPNDLEICRICALSVFFLERTTESYSAVERLYKCSDEDYNEFSSCIENRVRFELLPILKRGLLFDPEFWNLSMIQRNCADLLGVKNAIVLDSTNKLDLVIEQNMHADLPVINISNGTIEHNISSSIQTRMASSKRNNTVLSPQKMEHNVPRHYCTLCNKEFLGGHIFRHAQAHQKKGCFSCVICARKFRNRAIMLKHLKNHIKKMDRQPVANLDDAASNDSSNVLSDTNEVNSSDDLSLCLENGSSNNSSNVALTTIPNSEVPPQDLSDTVIPVENHIIDHSVVTVNHEADLKNSDEDTTACETKQDESSLTSDSPEFTKINGSLYPDSDDNLVNHEGPYKCPARECSRIFQRVGSLNKHARKAHSADLNVQQHLMKWNKGKCRYCQRMFYDSKHFMDHLKRHVYPKVYFCQHLNCNEKFKLAAQLTAHLLSHDSFKAQCSFMNCSDLFETLSSLYKHEALHYEPNGDSLSGEAASSLPVKKPTGHVVEGSVLDLVDKQNNVAVVSNKGVGLVKDLEIVDMLVPGWKSKKDVAKPKTYTQTEKKLNDEVQDGDETPNHSEIIKPVETPAQKSYQENVGLGEQVLNGHSACDQTVGKTVSLVSAHIVGDTNNRLVSDTAQEEPRKMSSSEQAEGASKPYLNSSASYGVNTIRPFMRPLPPTYLDERYISMPKRRKMGEEDKTLEIDNVNKQPVERFRCETCLTNYCSSEALNTHLAQKKCQLYFGFDSDDEITVMAVTFGTASVEVYVLRDVHSGISSSLSSKGNVVRSSLRATV